MTSGMGVSQEGSPLGATLGSSIVLFWLKSPFRSDGNGVRCSASVVGVSAPSDWYREETDGASDPVAVMPF
jgi:hypothetical protein